MAMDGDILQSPDLNLKYLSGRVSLILGPKEWMRTTQWDYSDSEFPKFCEITFSSKILVHSEWTLHFIYLRPNHFHQNINFVQ